MPDVEKSKYFYRGRSQNWKTWKFRILTPRAHAATHIDIRNTFHNFKNRSVVRADATEVPMPKHNPLAQTVYPLQGGKVHPNFENKKKFSEKKF